MNFPRKRTQPAGGGNYGNNNGGGSSGSNQNRNKPRFSSNGGGQNNNGGGGNRPRKNYGAMREKYLAQARDALSAGDRVLAENYFQHADHCFRMLAEENANRPQRQPQHNNQAQQSQQTSEQTAENTSDSPENNQENQNEAADSSSEGDDTISLNVSSLPAFLTASYTPPKVDNEPTPPQNWEEQ